MLAFPYAETRLPKFWLSQRVKTVPDFRSQASCRDGKGFQLSFRFRWDNSEVRWKPVSGLHRKERTMERKKSGSEGVVFAQEPRQTLADDQIVTQKGISRRSFLTAASSVLAGSALAVAVGGQARAQEPDSDTKPKKKDTDADQKKKASTEKNDSDSDKKKKSKSAKSSDKKKDTDSDSKPKKDTDSKPQTNKP